MSDGNGGVRIGVYVCHCGTNIAKTVDVEAVAAASAAAPGVVVARHYKFMCSDPGQELIQRDVRELGLTRVVVAACSPLMHEPTFRKAVEKAGLNRYLFAMANVREQVSWVSEKGPAATEKARAMVAAAVRRVALQEPLEMRRVAIRRRALVVGGGIAGIEAALQMADAGFDVVLVERETSIGGHMVSFDKTFPTLDCAACILTPKMVAVAQHPKIRLVTGAEVEKVEGYVGSFQATIRVRPRYVDVKRCNGCGACYDACPSRAVPARRRMRLGGRVYKEGAPRSLAPGQRHAHRVSRPGLPEGEEAAHE
ncbi:MAG: CoB--CoM heterodisulfide reductase iron-sulfur subunit A family protein [Acidobacteria bacterium]|nr:MAG: CoB--CoM heterodisulfide reductase iron-sulfur subunit A family protein [Acidobacteriota bacterium]